LVAPGEIKVRAIYGWCGPLAHHPVIAGLVNQGLAIIAAEELRRR
jgi:hypothetical protein